MSRRWLMTGLAASLLAVAGAWGGLRRRLRRFPYATGPARSGPLPAAWQPWAVGPLSLRGAVRKPAFSAAPWLLFFSGNDEAMLQTGITLLEAIRGQQDWGLAVVAYRGFDGSPGAPGVDTCLADAALMRNALMKAEGLSGSQLHLVAFSMGAPMCLAAAAEATRQGQPPASISLLAPAFELEMTGLGTLGRFLPGDAYSVEPAIDAVISPTLVICGEADEALGIEQSRAIVKRLGAHAELLALPGIRHNPLLAEARAHQAVAAFVDKHTPRI